MGLTTISYPFPGLLRSKDLHSQRYLFQCGTYLLFLTLDVFASHGIGMPSIIGDFATTPVKEALISASLLGPNIVLTALSVQLGFQSWPSRLAFFSGQILAYLITTGILLRLSSDTESQYAAIANFVAFGNTFGTAHAISLLVQKHRTPGSEKRWQWIASFKRTTNVRGVGTPRCNPDVVHRGPEPTANKPAFIVKRALQLYFNWRLLRIRDGLVWLASRPCYGRICLYSSGTYIRRILTGEATSKETVVRIMLSSSAWAYSQMYMTVIHCALSIFFVSLGDSPAEWPDLFGDVSEAVNIRTFFTRYWHTLHYRGFVEFGKILSFQVLELGEGSRAASFAIRGFVFLSSGLIHGCLSWVVGDVCAIKPEIYQYLQFAIALAAEDLIIRTYQGCFGKAHDPFTRSVFRNLGRLWVFTVMFVVVADAEVMTTSCEAAFRRAKRVEN
jgi:hypothetical protein